MKKKIKQGDQLSCTERRIFDLVLTGGTNKLISEILFVSDKTVKYHLNNMYKKLGVKRKPELIILAFTKPHLKWQGIDIEAGNPAGTT